MDLFTLADLVLNIRLESMNTDLRFLFLCNFKDEKLITNGVVSFLLKPGTLTPTWHY